MGDRLYAKKHDLAHHHLGDVAEMRRALEEGLRLAKILPPLTPADVPTGPTIEVEAWHRQ